MTGNATAAPQRELASRVSGGIEVALFWKPLSDELAVTVSDAQTGTHFELSAEPHEALEVFEHPYARLAAVNEHRTEHRAT